MQTLNKNVISDRNIIIENSATRNFLADAYYPKSAKRLPLIIFAHGYKGYKDWGAWNLMAEKIAQAGFYFVKFNFSHNGTTVDHPTEFADLEAFANNNFTKEMLDYNAVINHFCNIPEVNHERIAIIGHSRGAGISVIKAFEDDRVKALVSLAGVSHFGYRFPSGDRLQDWKDSGVMYSENARTKQQMPHYYQFYEDYKNNEQRFSVQYCAQHLEKPLLILQGTEDNAVKDKEAHLLHKWCKGSDLVILEGANHTLGATEPWEHEFMPRDLLFATNKIIEFLEKKV